MTIARIAVCTLASVTAVKLLMAGNASAAKEGLPGIPMLQPTSTYTVQSDAQGEELQDQRGFGDNEKAVAMMNLMMVEGSGYEGMDMSGMDMAAPATPPGKAAPPPMADMHGAAIAKATAATAEPSASVAASPHHASAYTLKAAIAPTSPKVGPNIVTVTVHGKHGHPARGLRVKAQVYMTSMDMGTDEPKVKEVGPGTYRLKAIFSMKGPWAVKILLPDGSEQVFNYSVMRK